MEVKHKKFQYYGSSLKNPIFRNNYRWDCLKRGFGQFANLRGAWRKRGGGVFERRN